MMKEPPEPPPESQDDEPRKPAKVEGGEATLKLIESLAEAGMRAQEILRQKSTRTRNEKAERKRPAERRQDGRLELWSRRRSMSEEAWEFYRKYLTLVTEAADAHDRERGISVEPEAYAVTAEDLRVAVGFLRAESGLSEDELDQRTGLGRRWFQRLLRGGGELPEAEVALALKALGEDAEGFFEEMEVWKLEQRWSRFVNRMFPDGQFPNPEPDSRGH